MSLSTHTGSSHNGGPASALVQLDQVLSLPKDEMAEQGTGGALAAPLPDRRSEDHQSFAH